jgi:O-antigen/teichoic acid export membrane protein
MIKRVSALLKTSAARDGVLVIGAQGIAVLIALCVESYLFRELPKAEQGALSSGLALSAVLLQAFDLGLALTTIRVGAKYIAEGRHDKAAQLFRATLAARVVLAGLVILATAIFSNAIARDILSMPDGRRIVTVAALGVMGNAMVWWGVDVAQARRAFESYAIQQIGAAAAKTLAIVLAAVLFVHAFTENAAHTILMAIAVANLGSGLFSIILSRGSLRAVTTATEKPAENETGQRIHLFEFGMYACAVSVLTALSANADVLLVQHYLGVEDTAVFACARRLAMALNLLATASITVLLPRAALLESRAACMAYVRKALTAGLVMAFVAAGGLALAASIFVPLFGGPEYRASIPILQWLCVAHGIGMVLTPLTLVFYPLRQEGILVFLNALQLGAHLVLGIVLTPLFKLEGAAWAMIGSRTVVAIAAIFFLAWAFKRADSVSKSPAIQ